MGSSRESPGGGSGRWAVPARAGLRAGLAASDRLRHAAAEACERSGWRAVEHDVRVAGRDGGRLRPRLEAEADGDPCWEAGGLRGGRPGAEAEVANEEHVAAWGVARDAVRPG